MYFTVEKAQRYISDLKKHVYEKKMPISTFKYCPRPVEGAHLPDFDDSSWEEFAVGGIWGGRDVTAWFRTRVQIPEEWRGEKLALNLVLGAGQEGGLRGSESLLYINGQPVQGLDQNHREVYLKPEVVSGGTLQIAIKAFSGLQDERKVFRTAELVVINEAADDFYYRAATMLDTIKVLKEGDYNRENLIRLLNEAINKIDFRKPGSQEFYTSITRANAALQEQLSQLKEKEGRRPVVTAIGHSHIDVAWLWRLCHTREKCSRTFSTVTHLMDQYPQYQFLQSQPQLYEYIKQDYPEIFARIKEKIAAGKWEVTGGMWVEADCNVPSGESLVRQFLFGTRFMKEEFGIDCNILWLPDVFGYSWALPQIIKKSGLKYFMTTKISWSQYNRPEYDTFNWRGIDGTEVLTHFITTTEAETPRFYTYNGVLNPASVQRGWEHYQQKDINDELLLSFGWGDGGGGPTKKMIETGAKMQELPGIPEVRFGKAEDFFARLDKRVKDNPKLPVVDGELYLEYHRGTYTSQARTKKNNRKSEILYHDLELFNSWAAWQVPGHQYPQNEINEGWKTILRNQFHDILPGSSIHEVYEDSAAEFERVFASGNRLLNGALSALAGQVEVSGAKLVVFNSLGWARDGEVVVPWSEELAGKAVVDEDGNKLPAWKVERDDKQELHVTVPEIPSFGYRTFELVEAEGGDVADSSLKVTAREVENRFYRIKLNDKGQITSIFDKEANREVLPEGAVANALQAFEDKPMMFDAWDIDIYYQEKQYPVEELLECEVEEAGPQRGVLRLKWKFLDSEIEQRMVVYADRRRIDFVTDVDWREHQILLKAAFPVDVRTTKATYEIQFGNVERPTHWNTSWDYAKFESVGHKWADLSERDYGVSLLNDCKYGYDIKDNVMRLTLLKSGIDPDPEADQGRHSFTYSLYPHAGDWFEGETVREAYELNYPLHCVIAEGEGGKLPASHSLINVLAQSAMLETVKQAEDDDSLILRFYEFGNRRDKVQVKLAGKIKALAECNLMEEELSEMDHTGKGFGFVINPYEIKTFKVRI